MEDLSRSPNPKRFYRSPTDRMLAGVCAGIAHRMGWDPTLVRIAAVAAVLTGFFSGIVIMAYLITWLVTPCRQMKANMSADEESFWRGVADRPKVTLSNIRYKFKDMEERLQRLEKSVTSDEWRLRRQFRDLEQN